MKSAISAIAAASLVAMFWAGGAPAQDVPQQATVPPNVGNWVVSMSATGPGSTEAVSVRTETNEQISYLLGEEGPAALVFRCVNNNTSIAFDFGDNFMSDIGDYGTISISIDDLPARRLSFSASENRRELGINLGVNAIPLINSLLNRDTLQISATPLYGDPFEVNFEIAGLREAISPLRQACRW